MIFFFRISFLCLLFCGQVCCAQRLPDSLIFQTISKANNYLSQHKNSFDSQFNLLILKQLENNFQYHAPFTLDSLLEKEPLYSDEKKAIPLFKKIAYCNENKNLSYIDSLQGLEKLMAWAIHSDKKKIDTVFESLLWEYSDKNQVLRNVAHAALVVAWLRENRQLAFFPHTDSLILQQTQILSRAILSHPHRVSDSEMEAALALLYLKQKMTIAEAWFTCLLDSQEADGGWAMNEGFIFQQSAAHPTTLAIWLWELYAHPVGNWEILAKEKPKTSEFR